MSTFILAVMFQLYIGDVYLHTIMTQFIATACLNFNYINLLQIDFFICISV